MVEPYEPEKKREQEKVMKKKERKAALGIVSQLVRYVPRTHSRPSRRKTKICRYRGCGGSLWIFGSFIKDRDWRVAVITFPIMVIMVARECIFQRFFTPESKENG